MRLNHRGAIALYGFIWFGIGLWLLSKGLSLLIVGGRFYAPSGEEGKLLKSLIPMSGGTEQAVLVLIVIGLVLGFIKGRTVLRKSVKRAVSRIVSLPAPIPLTKLFSIAYLVLMGVMVCLGISMRLLSLSFDLRGVIDVAVGSALINGGADYFRAVIDLKNQAPTSSDLDKTA